MLNKHNYQKGQTIIEALGALAILSIIITATTVAVTTSLNNATFNKNVTLATKYAQQGTEIVRQLRDNNYTTFRNWNSPNPYCLGKNQSSFGGSCTTPNVDNFIRTVLIQPSVPDCGANAYEVTVTVKFTDSKCTTTPYCHSQIDTSCLSITNPVTAP